MKYIHVKRIERCGLTMFGIARQQDERAEKTAFFGARQGAVAFGVSCHADHRMITQYWNSGWIPILDSDTQIAPPQSLTLKSNHIFIVKYHFDNFQYTLTNYNTSCPFTFSRSYTETISYLKRLDFTYIQLRLTKFSFTKEVTATKIFHPKTIVLMMG